MSISSKSTSLQAYNLLLFRNAVHPEFFKIEDRMHIDHGEYEFEAWIFRGGHALRFEHNGICLTEIVTAATENVPDRGLVTSFPCAGEKDHEQEFADRVTYLASMQTETLSEHLYLSTHQELIDHAENTNSLCVSWSEDLGNPSLSMVDIQRFRNEMHIQSYHLRSDCGLVLRTQTIFQVNEES